MHHPRFAALKTRLRRGRGLPAYGTCAGLILLSDEAVGQKAGGQPLVGGLDATVCRNYFGAQVASFEVPLETSGFAGTFPAVFIRAPAILRLGDEATPLATVTAAPCAAARGHVDAFRRSNHEAEPEPEPSPSKKAKTTAASSSDDTAASDNHRVIVAARQGNLLVTAFHPELTQDTRWHRVFLDICRTHAAKAGGDDKAATNGAASTA